MVLSVPSSWEMLLFIVQLKVRTAVGGPAERGPVKAVGRELRFGGPGEARPCGVRQRASATQNGYKVRNFWPLPHSRPGLQRWAGGQAGPVVRLHL